MKLVYVLAAVITFAFCYSTPTFAQKAFTRNFAISESCRLTEEQRYADAVLMAERLHLVCPNDLTGLEVDGAVALQVGAISNASAYFNTALSITPDGPLALYGKTLVALLKNKNQLALTLVSSIDTADLSPDALDDITILQSICLAQNGNIQGAISELGTNSDPTAQEIVALLTCREDHSKSALLASDLTAAMVDGVPEVVEEPGLRLLLPQNQTGAAIEPSIIDPETQQDLANRFDSSYISGGLKTVSGIYDLDPPRMIDDATASVMLSVDGSLAAVSNTFPYRFRWDSSAVPNGAHTVTFALNNSAGTLIDQQDENLFVINTDPPESENSGPAPQDLIDRIWRLIRIHPDYKVAEYELATDLKAQGDSSGYETHMLRAAALDPEYLDVRDRLHPLFLGQVPAAFPVPDGTTLPSSLGLSAGSASKAGFWAGSPHVREIALTFDDGPLPGPTRQLLDALRSVNALGTFFVVGMRAAESPDSLRQMAADGHAVEDHTYTHPNLTQILPQHVLQEILRTAVVIQAITGSWPHFLRPPGGNTDPFVLQTAKICGMSGAFWTIDALPAEEGGSPQGVVNWVLDRARPGAIVLMHNGMAATVGAIPDLVVGLRQRGYKLVTIRQLAADALAGRQAST